jgi:hypothetical protein
MAEEMFDAFYGHKSTELGGMLAEMFPKGWRFLWDFFVGRRHSEDEDVM